MDDQSKYISWQTHYNVKRESLKDGLDITEGIRLYTDGSKIGTDTGYGAVLYNERNEIVNTINGKMEDHATVFQAECVAM